MSNDNFNKPNDAGAQRVERSIRLDVQGLRAVAVLAVLLYHANDSWLKAGYVGVDVFFVISGFIITALLTERSGKVDLAAFYASRIKRIVPAYFLMLFVVAALSAVLFVPDDFAFFLDSLKSSAWFTSNHYFAHFGSYFAPRADELPLLHTWSLAIEMQFYLFFPIMVIGVPARWRLPAFSLVAIAAFAWVGYQTLGGQRDEMYFSLLARAPEFMVGAVVALLMRQRELPQALGSAFGIAGALMLGWALLAIEKQEFPGFWAIVPCVGAGMIIAARRGPVSTLLAASPMVWVGAISYSLYLWHWPVLALIRYYTGQHELTMAWLLVFAVASVALAWLSFRFIETPVRKARGFVRHAPKWAMAAAAVVLVAWGAVRINASLVDPLPVELTRYAAPETICHGTQIGSCKRGKPDADVSALVIGDSHAAQLNHFFDQVGNEQGVAYRVLTASSCVPIPGFDIERLPTWAQKACRDQVAAVAKALPEVDRVIVAGMWQYQMQSQAFTKALTDFLTTTAGAHKNVVVLAQVPMFETDVQRVRRFTELGLSAPLTFNREWQAANQQVKAIADRTPGARFLDFSSSSFFAAAPYEHGLLIYRDSHHLNEVGASRYGHYAAQQLQRAFDQPQSNVSLKP
ncbi:acyltransferase family protein [Pseudomonas sp. DCB_BI]|uniref:acyltransferase family protein n=1 Tax=Pseudomonas sp. DCB_BI TaxID=2993594 RepID=UPI00224A6F8E|nr:acyltransferase family protein [Pseudomonas sp. DCB_BI]MCX2889734.1 acyltransferase family protein [Pseudomonas sp. DCB_BI]